MSFILFSAWLLAQYFQAYSKSVYLVGVGHAVRTLNIYIIGLRVVVGTDLEYLSINAQISVVATVYN